MELYFITLSPSPAFFLQPTGGQSFYSLIFNFSLHNCGGDAVEIPSNSFSLFHSRGQIAREFLYIDPKSLVPEIKLPQNFMYIDPRSGVSLLNPFPQLPPSLQEGQTTPEFHLIDDGSGSPFLFLSPSSLPVKEFHPGWYAVARITRIWPKRKEALHLPLTPHPRDTIPVAPKHPSLYKQTIHERTRRRTKAKTPRPRRLNDQNFTS